MLHPTPPSPDIPGQGASSQPPLLSLRLKDHPWEATPSVAVKKAKNKINEPPQSGLAACFLSESSGTNFIFQMFMELVSWQGGSQATCEVGTLFTSSPVPG